MAFSLSKKLHNFRTEAIAEFYAHIGTLLENEQVQKLDEYIQHYCYSRLKHSLDVAYYSYMITRFLRWDSRSTARAALLHDLYLYDRRDDSYTGKHHITRHPRIALENARAICDLNKCEEDIIAKHMWLITPIPPRYKEGFVVTFVDKICAARELCISLFDRSTVRTAYASHS